MMRAMLQGVFAALLVLSAGCASSPDGPAGDHRMARYAPNVTSTPAGLPQAEAVAAVSMPAYDGDSGEIAARQHRLAQGDQIVTNLRGIPRPEDIKNVVDATGSITLPYIGQVQVAGLATSEAERLIERKYIEEGIFRSVNVIMVAEDKSYFVQGEVGRQGRFTMSAEVTLLKAIAEAGGYTPFANRRNVKVIRGEDVTFYNARDIANGRDPDPVIEANDIIVVLRSVF